MMTNSNADAGSGLPQEVPLVRELGLMDALCVFFRNGEPTAAWLRARQDRAAAALVGLKYDDNERRSVLVRDDTALTHYALQTFYDQTLGGTVPSKFVLEHAVTASLVTEAGGVVQLMLRYQWRLLDAFDLDNWFAPAPGLILASVPRDAAWWQQAYRFGEGTQPGTHSCAVASTDQMLDWLFDAVPAQLQAWSQFDEWHAPLVQQVQERVGLPTVDRPSAAATRTFLEGLLQSPPARDKARQLLALFDSQMASLLFAVAGSDADNLSNSVTMSQSVRSFWTLHRELREEGQRARFLRVGWQADWVDNLQQLCLVLRLSVQHSLMEQGLQLEFALPVLNLTTVTFNNDTRLHDWFASMDLTTPVKQDQLHKLAQQVLTEMTP